MDWSIIVGFTAMAAVVEISPGPNFLLITRSVPVFGKSGVMANVAGFACAYTMHGALAVYGISALLAAEPMSLIIIQLAGAFYLLLLGVKSLKPVSKKTFTLESIEQPVDILLVPATDPSFIEIKLPCMHDNMPLAISGGGSILDTGIDIVLEDGNKRQLSEGLFTCFRDGMLISALNPKICLFYMAAFPQFIKADTVAAQSSAFLLVFFHILVSAVWAIAMAVVLEYALNKAGSHDIADKLHRFSGVALIGLSAAFFAGAASAF